MQKKLIFLLAFMVLIAVFALQNSMEVQIKLWFWSVKTSMVLILILTFAAGALAGILFSIPKKSRESKHKAPDPVKQEAVNDLSENGKDPDPGEFEDVRR